MKENIKIFLIALILGMAVAFALSYKFKEPIAFALNPEATILYVASYNNIDTATSKQANYPDSVIYEEEGIYKIVIGIFSDKIVLDLMKSYFQDQGLTFYEEKTTISICGMLVCCMHTGRRNRCGMVRGDKL